MTKIDKKRQQVDLYCHQFPMWHSYFTFATTRPTPLSGLYAENVVAQKRRKTDHVFTAVLWIRNDFFVPDPDPGKSSGSMRIRIQPIFLKYIWKLWKKHLKFNQKVEWTNYWICHFLFHTKVQSYSTNSPEFTGLNWEIKTALSFFAASGSGTIIPDPGKSSRSMRIRIHNTGLQYTVGWQIQ